jgi:hypothetical protein
MPLNFLKKLLPLFGITQVISMINGQIKCVAENAEPGFDATHGDKSSALFCSACGS